MPKVTVDVNQKLIDEATKKELKSLRAQIVRLQNQVDKLKRQIANNQEIVLTAERIVVAVKDAGGFVDLEEYGSNA